MEAWCDGRIKCDKGEIAVGCDKSEGYRNLKCQTDNDWWGGKVRRSKRKTRKRTRRR